MSIWQELEQAIVSLALSAYAAAPLLLLGAGLGWLFARTDGPPYTHRRHTLNVLALGGVIFVFMATLMRLAFGLLLPEQPEPAAQKRDACDVQQQAARVHLSGEPGELEGRAYPLAARVLDPLANTEQEATDADQHQRPLEVFTDRRSGARCGQHTARDDHGDVPAV